MFVISGGRGIGKTRLLLEKIKEENAIIVCEDVNTMRERAYKYGITGLNILSYEEFSNSDKTYEENVYIHNMHKWLNYKYPTVKGYSVCNEG